VARFHLTSGGSLATIRTRRTEFRFHISESFRLNRSARSRGCRVSNFTAAFFTSRLKQVQSGSLGPGRFLHQIPLISVVNHLFPSFTFDVIFDVRRVDNSSHLASRQARSICDLPASCEVVKLLQYPVAYRSLWGTFSRCGCPCSGGAVTIFGNGRFLKVGLESVEGRERGFMLCGDLLTQFIDQLHGKNSRLWGPSVVCQPIA